jgi:hypothetical protein
MRVIPILLLTLVFGVAFGNYLVASNGPTGAALKRAAAVIMSTSAPSTLKDAASTTPQGAIIAPSTPPASHDAGPVHLASAATGTSAVACVHRNDGATVCGPVVEGSKKPAASAFDQPIVSQVAPIVPIVKPPNPAAATAKVVQRQAPHGFALTPKQVPTPPTPRKTKSHALAQNSRANTRHTQLVQGAPPASWPDRKVADPDEPRDIPSHYSRSRSPSASLRQPPYPLTDFPPNRLPPTSMTREQPAGGVRYDPRPEAPSMLEGQWRPRSSSANRIPPANDGDALMLPGWRRMPANHDAERGAAPSLDREPRPRQAANHYPPVNERDRLVRSGTGDIKYSYGPGPTPRPDRARDAKLVDFDRRASALERQLRVLRGEYADALRPFRNRADARPSAPPERRDKPAGNFD